MLKFVERNSTLKILPILGLLFWLNGCGVKPVAPPVKVAPAILGEAPLTASHYRQQAAASQGNQQHYWLLMASRAYLNQGQTDEALFLLNQLRPQLTSDDQLLEFQLLSSMSLSLLGKHQDAVVTLNKDPRWQLSDNRWQQYYQLEAELQFKLEQPIDAAIALMNKGQYVADPEAIKSNHKIIWFYLSQSNADALINRQSSADDFPGWKSLKLLSDKYAMDPDRLVAELKRWTSNFSSHPAANQLPSNLTLAMTLEPYQPQKIALLLPLSGRFGRSGKALRDGLISSMMARQSQAELLLMDTQALGATQAYQQALAAGAEFVIGPLLKANVEALTQINPTVPMLSLNLPPALPEPGQQRYFFALDRLSEASQAAERILSQGKHQPAVIAPATPQGQQVSEHFVDQWQQQTSEEPEPSEAQSYFFAKDSKLQDTVEELFEVDQSQARINEMRYLLTNKLKSETRSRRDIDAIYLMASPRQTRLLKPFVDVAVSQFAPSVSVYVSSNGNDNSANQQDNRDINQLNVSEIPWLLNQTQSISPAEVQTLWPDLNQSQLRLYAMGYDAFDLIGKLAQMELFPEYKLNGLSGELRLTAEGTIDRKLNWAQYQRGKLLPQ